jgi:hypothetical protein
MVESALNKVQENQKQRAVQRLFVASAEDFPYENSEVITNLKDPTTGHLDICFIYVNLFSGHY